MAILAIVLKVLLFLSSFFLILTILLHKGQGGGLSDMFGGGMTNSLNAVEQHKHHCDHAGDGNDDHEYVHDDVHGDLPSLSSGGVPGLRGADRRV